MMKENAGRQGDSWTGGRVDGHADPGKIEVVVSRKKKETNPGAQGLALVR